MSLLDKAVGSARHEAWFWKAALRRRRRLRTARRRAFVDCGANTCRVLRSFARHLPRFELFAFEAQPELRRFGEAAVRDLGESRLRFVDKAVWTRDGTVDFFLATHWGPNYRGGSTLVTGSTLGASSIDYGAPVAVQAVDFSRWIAEEFAPQDYVIVKMDIEGAEYDVLEKVAKDGHLPLIDELLVEFHQSMNPGIPESRHEDLIALLRRETRLELWH